MPFLYAIAFELVQEIALAGSSHSHDQYDPFSGNLIVIHTKLYWVERIVRLAMFEGDPGGKKTNNTPLK
jgi:hypothetical protein